MGWVGEAANLLGLGGLVAVAFIGLFNKGLKNDRIEHLKGRVDELSSALKDERESCNAKIARMSDEMSKMRGQMDVLSGEFGAKIGKEVVHVVEAHLRGIFD